MQREDKLVSQGYLSSLLTLQVDCGSFQPSGRLHMSHLGHRLKKHSLCETFPSYGGVWERGVVGGDDS